MKWYLFLVLTFSAFPILAVERTHRIRCITLDDNYKADGGSFVIQKSVGGNSERASITNVVGNSLPRGYNSYDL